MFLLALYMITWVKLAIEGHYGEIVDDFLLTMFFTILWGQQKHTTERRQSISNLNEEL